jgi:hypothetical protein
MTTVRQWSIIGEAGVKVTKNNTCKKMELKKKIVEEYANVIRSLDTSLFQSSELRNDIYTRLAGGRIDTVVPEIRFMRRKQNGSQPSVQRMQKAGSCC